MSFDSGVLHAVQSLIEVYGIHNAPNLPFGQFFTTPGALMASVDTAFV
jgi:hippurate hydrolase